jgi:predicted peptidase
MKWALLHGGWLAALLIGNVAGAVTISDFIDFSLRDPGGNVVLPGRLYVPPAAMGDASRRHPLMTMLHGGGGRGTDNLAQLAFVSDGMLRAADERGALLYLPQTVDNWGGSLTTSRVMTMIDQAIAAWNVDNNRQFMLGYSNGGGGVWNMLSRYDGRFAAAISMSGVTPASDFVAARLVDTPILALHARDDATVSVSVSRNVISGILRADRERPPTYLAPSNPATFLVSNSSLDSHAVLRELAHEFGDTTDYLLSDPEHDLLYIETAGGGHTGLLGAFNSDEVFDWLFAHPAVPEPSSLVLLLAGAAIGGGRWRQAAWTRRA